MSLSVAATLASSVAAAHSAFSARCAHAEKHTRLKPAGGQETTGGLGKLSSLVLYSRAESE
eukprot:4804401-Pleurochrysis_carterae.AAC.1